MVIEFQGSRHHSLTLRVLIGKKPKAILSVVGGFEGIQTQLGLKTTLPECKSGWAWFAIVESNSLLFQFILSSLSQVAHAVGCCPSNKPNLPRIIAAWLKK